MRSSTASDPLSKPEWIRSRPAALSSANSEAEDRDRFLDVLHSLNIPLPDGHTAFSVDGALKSAKEIGYPVMLKARAGGGGRGIRMIAAPEDMQNRFPLAIKEAESAFGDGALYIEKYISG